MVVMDDNDNADWTGNESVPEVRVRGLLDDLAQQPLWVDDPNLLPLTEQERRTFSS